MGSVVLEYGNKQVKLLGNYLSVGQTVTDGRLTRDNDIINRVRDLRNGCQTNLLDIGSENGATALALHTVIPINLTCCITFNVEETNAVSENFKANDLHTELRQCELNSLSLGLDDYDFKNYNLIRINIGQGILDTLASLVFILESGLPELIICCHDDDLMQEVSYFLGKHSYRCVCQLDNNQNSYFSRIDNSSNRILFTATADNFHFVQPIMRLAQEEKHYVSKVSLKDLSQESLLGSLRHSDIAWFEWGDGPIIAASRFPKFCRIICRIHRYELYNSDFLKVNWDNVDEVIFVSYAMKKLFISQLKGKLPVTLKLSVIANLSEHEFKVIHEKKQEKKRYNLGCVARFTSVKNPMLLALIMQELVKIDRRYNLSIVGRIEDICLFKSFFDFVNLIGLSKNISYDGVIDADKMVDWYASKSINLSTSYNESQGMGLFESMLAGVKPVAFSAAGGLDEYMPSEFLFTSISEAVEKITTNISTPDVYAQFAISILHQKEIKDTYRYIFAREFEESTSFSILIPCYNREKEIIGAVSSALNQRYNNFDVVVVDDGSCDDSIAVLCRFNDKRLRIVKKNHTNAPDTRNRCIAEATGSYFVWLDSDDFLHENSLCDYNKIIVNHPDTDIISTGLESLGLDHKEYYLAPKTARPEFMVNKIIYGNFISNPGCCVSAKLYEKVGGYSEYYPRAHDYEFWSRAVGKGKVFLDHYYHIMYRIHDNSLTGARRPINLTYEYRIFESLLNRYSIKQLFPSANVKDRLVRQKIERFIDEKRKDLIKSCALDNLTVVIDAFGDNINFLEQAIYVLGRQRDSDFNILVVSDHDLSFLSIPIFYAAFFNVSDVNSHILKMSPSCFNHIFLLGNDLADDDSLVSKLKNSIMLGDNKIIDNLFINFDGML